MSIVITTLFIAGELPPEVNIATLFIFLFFITNYLKILLNTVKPKVLACKPNSSSISIKRLYLQILSLRDMLPVLICPAFKATARSAIVASSVSPERWDITLFHPAFLAIKIVSIVSDKEPIWFNLINIAFAIFYSMPCSRILGFVQNTSSPTICTLLPISFFNFLNPSQSFSLKPSSIEIIGYFVVNSFR